MSDTHLDAHPACKYGLCTVNIPQEWLMHRGNAPKKGM